ncbi:hypothetical protein Tco_1022216 [Tanacetum coccineum]
MERDFLSQKGSGVGRGFKEKDLNRNKKSSSSGIGVSTDSEDNMNDDTPVGVASAVSTTAGNAPCKSSYANITGKPRGKKVNVHTLFTPGGNEIDVVVSVDSIRAISERFANTAYGFFLGKEGGMPCRSSYAGVMIELQADVELKDNIVVAMPKIIREGHYTCVGDKKTVKKPSQTSRDVPVGLKMGFKPHKEYRPVLKKSTDSSSGDKKKGDEPIIEVSNSNPFNVLNSVNNDVKFGTNARTTNLVNNGATSSGSSFINVDNSSSGTTPIIEKIRKFEDLLTSGQAILVDKEGNPLKKVEFLGEDDSEDEVASVDNDMARSLAYERGFGTQSLLEQ